MERLLKNPSLRMQKARRSIALALFLCAGISGCGGKSVPTYTSTETPTSTTTIGILDTPTATPSIIIQLPTSTPGSPTSDIPLGQKDCVTLDGGGTYIAEGDLLVNGKKPFDDIQTTGTEYAITADAPTQICAPYGGDIHQVSSTADVVAAEEQQVYQGLRRSGCASTSGCTDGVEFVTVENGQIQSVVLHNGQNFTN